MQQFIVHFGVGRAALDHSEVDTVNQLNSSSFSNKMLPNDESDHPETTSVGKPPLNNGKPAENAIDLPQQDGLKLLIPSNLESLTIENLQMDQTLNLTIQKNTSGSEEKDTILLLSTPDSVLGESNMGCKIYNSANIPSGDEHYFGAVLPAESVIIETENEKDKDKDGASEVSQHHIVQNKVEITLVEPLKFDKDVPTSSIQDTLLLRDGRVNLSKHLQRVPAERTAGEDTIITVEPGQLEAAHSQRAQNILVSSGTTALPHTQSGISAVEEKGTTAREVLRLDIIKSVVYGALIESITSLGVVSSAAGADVATLNVVALGLANLFGGLFVISHNLWNLKNDRIGGPPDQVTEQVDWYQELLGRRADFLLHAIVVVLSFLIFGLLPPVIYGFSFRKSNDRDLKLVMVAAASLICVIILATGKAFVQRPPKSYLKSLMHYVAMGVMVSGVSYIIGSLLKKFLEKVGIFQSSSVVTLTFPGARSMKPSWGTY